MKENYFYIDESGGIESNSKFFILGCYKTDTPEFLSSSLSELKNEILESPIYATLRKDFLNYGIHACKNHQDIRIRFYNLISTLNIRAYILLLDKNSDFFKDLMSKGIPSNEIYKLCIHKLLKDRLIKNRFDKNILIFEQYGNNINKWQNSIEEVISNIKNDIEKTSNIDCQCEIFIHDKSDINLSIVDYLNYIFSHCFELKEPWPRMIDNFNIIEPKIGLIYKLDKDLFYDKNKRFDIKNY